MLHAIYMAISPSWRVLCGVKFTRTEGNLGCHGLFALTPNRVKGIWVAGCSQGRGLEIAVLIRGERQRSAAQAPAQRTRPSAMSRLAVILVAVVGQTAAFHAPSVRSAATARAPAPAAGLFDFLAVGKAGASHILLPPGSSKARYIKEEIEKGKMTFEAAAKEFSECPSASKGGNLGTFGRGQMVGPFDSYCFDPDSKVGALEIVKTSFGTHIVKLTKKP
jgi:parvulin-like peptidyl-prolyl isomerase